MVDSGHRPRDKSSRRGNTRLLRAKSTTFERTPKNTILQKTPRIPCSNAAKSPVVNAADEPIAFHRITDIFDA